MTLLESPPVAASSGRFAALRQDLTPGIAALLLLETAFLAVPPVRLPTIALDSGWQFGLVRALAEGRRFGTDVVFTYGPWAELDVVTPLRLVFLVVGLAGVVVSAVLLVGVSWTLARSWLAPRQAAVLTLVTIAPAIALRGLFSERVLVLSVLVLVGVVTGAVPESWHRWVFPALAALGGLTIETKFSNGTLAIATTLAAALFASPAPARRRVRRVLVSLVTALVSVVVFWLLAGQPLSGLPSWVTTSLEVTAGYSDGMSAEYGAAGEYVLFAVVVVALGFALLHRQDRWGVVRAVLTVAWIALVGLRLGFTRHDSGHVVPVFVLLTAAFVAARMSRHTWLPIVGAAVSTALAFGLATADQGYFAVTDPARWGKNATALVSDLVSGEERDESLEDAYSDVRTAAAVPPEVVDALRGKTVAADPWDINVVLAHHLPWQPVPVIQTYSAYTAELDRLDAEALASPDGPQAILRRASEAADGRNPLWESPAYMLAMLCHYRPVAQSDVWMALEKTASRCGESTVLSTVPVTAGQAVPIPHAPDGQAIVVASFDLPQPFGERLAEAIFKPGDAEYLGVSDGSEYRIPRAHLGGPLLTTIPVSSGWTAPFGGGLMYTTITAPQDGTVTFSAIEIAP